MDMPLNEALTPTLTTLHETLVQYWVCSFWELSEPIQYDRRSLAKLRYPAKAGMVKLLSKYLRLNPTKATPKKAIQRDPRKGITIPTTALIQPSSGGLDFLAGSSSLGEEELELGIHGCLSSCGACGRGRGLLGVRDHGLVGGLIIPGIDINH